MAGPPGYAYTHRLDTEQSAEDCRDYLRTGRCKYGASCKYNHPSNVQNGGGMKAPINPSEPLYPVRPNEPTCQYYMKHGTCKFGQACKFHHPPQSAVTTALLSGNAVVMNVGRGTEAGSQQILLNSLGSDAATASGVTLQFLPQRPGEPDCIYFLRNGRCKYGASCRYHHPVSVHQRKRGDLQGGASHRQPAAQLVAQANAAEDFGRRPRSSSLQGPTNYSQVAQQRTRPPPKGPPVHYVVGDGQFAVVAVNNRSSSTPQYRQAGDSTEYYVSQGTAAPPGMRQESSSSSIASSYETASSGFDYMSQHGDPNVGGVWIRTRVGSGGSLNTLSENESTQMHQSMMYRSDSRAALAPSVSDNNLVGRNRGESFGSSASDNSARVHPESAAWPVSSGPPPGVRAWPKSGTLAVHPSAAAGDRSDEHHVADEGLSMMTSALLNMLDTPEDAAAKSYTQAAGGAQSPPSTPNEGAVLPSTEGQVHSSTPSFSEQRPSGRMATSSRYTFTANQRVADVRGRGAIGLGHPPTLPRVPAPSSAVQGELRGWSPTWPTPSQAQQLEQTTHAMSVLQQAPEGNTQHTSDVGLYLP